MLGARVPALPTLGSLGLDLGEAERAGPEIIPNLLYSQYQPSDPEWGLQALWSLCGSGSAGLTQPPGGSTEPLLWPRASGGGAGAVTTCHLGYQLHWPLMMAWTLWSDTHLCCFWARWRGEPETCQHEGAF